MRSSSYFSTEAEVAEHTHCDYSTMCFLPVHLHSFECVQRQCSSSTTHLLNRFFFCIFIRINEWIVFLLISIAIFVLAFLSRTIKSSAANCWLLYNIWNNDNFRNFFFSNRWFGILRLRPYFTTIIRKNNVIANDKCVIAKSVCGDFNDFNIFHSFCISWYGCRLPAEKQLYFTYFFPTFDVLTVVFFSSIE